MSEMRLTNTLIQWLEQREWEERPEVNEEAQTSRLGFEHSIGNDFSGHCYYDINEQAGFFKLFVYFDDTKMPAAKFDEVVKWVNSANLDIQIGHLVAMPDDRILRFYAAIDVDNAAFEPAHITNILDACLRVMELRLPQYMAICFAGKTAEEAMEIKPE